MSRKPIRSKRPQQSGSRSDQGHRAGDAIIAEAHALYGREAATAVAYCGLDAWFDGHERKFRCFAEMFRRFKN
jgi:hypothetical protein